MTDDEYMKTVINMDESNVPSYTLPSALIDERGHTIATAFDWMNQQRPKIVTLFEKYIYGALPPCPDSVSHELLNLKENALHGLAIRKEVRIHLAMRNGKKHHVDLLLYIPKAAITPVPAFLGLSFFGNHATTTEVDVILSERWMRPVAAKGIVDNRATESSRGQEASRWPIDMILQRGYAVATMYHGDIYPDHGEGWNLADAWNACIWRLFAEEPSPYHTALSAWAWGLCRGLDYLESDSAIAKGRVAVIGHSRLGKAALWAGAQDQRFGMTISNDSGSAGAALTRRRFGETIQAFPRFGADYWCVPDFYPFDCRESELPVDQHMLISLLAPRLAYVGSASMDLWADPRGEFLSTVHAAPVYRLFGSKGLMTDIMPPADQPIHADLGYHLRSGKHDITEQDWRWYLDYADMHWKKA